MFATRLDLSVQIRSESIKLLQARLSDALDLEAQAKQAHWNVRGKTFFQLHELFDKIHSDVEEFVDTIAERITTLGGVADGRVQTTAKSTTIPEYPLDATSADVHLKAFSAAIAEFGKTVRLDIDKATKFGDADTADVFTEISRAADQQLWFVESHLSD